MTGRRRRGSSIIEFALAFPVVFAIFGATFQFGYAFYVYNRLQTAVRGGARYAALRTYNAGTTAFQTAVKNQVVYGNPSGGSSPVVPGLTTGAVKVDVLLKNGVPEIVSVAVDDYTIAAVFKRFRLRGKPNAAFRYEGRLSGS